LAGRFDKEVSAEADFSSGIIDKHVDTIRGKAETLAGTISAPLDAKGPATGLENIAKAYEDWLVGGGMNALLAQIAPHFANRPSAGEAGGPLRLQRGQFDRPRASVEIERVEIVLEPEAAVQVDPAGAPALVPLGRPTDEEIYEALMRHVADMEDRAIRPADPRAFLA
jgi:hypothetical protein